MDATPRLRSAFPSTPQRSSRTPAPRRAEPPKQTAPTPQKSLPSIPTLSRSTAASTEPVIPEHIIDAPSQRLYAVAIWVALWTWRLYDYTGLQEADEQSLWLFLKWTAIDGVYLYGLPNLRIPWMEWSTSTMTLLFLAHAFADAMLMFRLPLPIGAGFAVIWRGIWGGYETAVNEYHVNPNSVLFNESLILGRQTIHILPEGSAILNPDRHTYCLDAASGRAEIKLPIMINATSPVGIDLVRVDLDKGTNETIHISKSQIKTMHKEASRLLSYSENPNEPKTLYYAVKKPGVYLLAKVVDETNLEVARKRLAHTVVVSCPKAAILPSPPNMCRGAISEVDFEVTGTPPMKVKYRKMINHATQDATFESIQSDDFVSPLLKQSQNALVLPDRIDVEWARAYTVKVPLSESMSQIGRWVYAIDEVTDGLGNVVSYSNPDHSRDQKEQEKRAARLPHLHQIVTVHDRPTISVSGCTPQAPMKIAKGRPINLPLKYGSIGRGEIADVEHHLEYVFSPESDMTATGEHTSEPQTFKYTAKTTKNAPQIREPGLYTLISVSTDFCSGNILEPDTCLLQNPPQPELSINAAEIFDKCAGSPIGLRVDLDLIGTPPFDIVYRTKSNTRPHHDDSHVKIDGLRGQVELTPDAAGTFTYDFIQVSDAVYKNQPLKELRLEQSVKPAAYAKFLEEKKSSCIDESVGFSVALVGEGPFTLEYELVHGGKRAKHSKQNLTGSRIELETGVLRDGGDYTLSLVSITDNNGCKEFLKDQAKVTVRHQKPKVGFGPIDGKYKVETLEDKTVNLPLRLSGEGPWNIEWLDPAARKRSSRISKANDQIQATYSGAYQLLSVSDAYCPGVVDDAAKDFSISTIARPELRVVDKDLRKRDSDHKIVKNDVCEGDEDAIEVLFKGSPPFTIAYEQDAKLSHGTVAPKKKELRAALNRANLHMDTSQAGAYDYKIFQLGDNNYNHDSKHFKPIHVQQTVHGRPSAAFKTPGKTYSFCSVESEGEEVIPVTLHGLPPFELEVEIKHHGTIKPELVSYTDITSNTHNIRIPHTRLHLGKSAVSLRRVSDARGCTRSLDSTTPRVQISVHDAPTITPWEAQEDFCVGERINFGLSGVAPFTIYYTFEGAARKATISSGNVFRRLADQPGTLVITGVSDSASSCRAAAHHVKHIHGMPSVRVSGGRDGYVDIREGSEAEIQFDFGGVPPFEFTYTRSSNTEKGGKNKGVVLDMRSEISDEHTLKIRASQEGTYEVISIKDRYCAYSKPGAVTKVDREAVKRLQY